jgi:prolyl-tRNA synthetase
MGSYGIGISRVMGAVVEIHHDEDGIIWPTSIAPFSVHLLLIGEPTPALKNFGDKIYNDLAKAGIEVLYDDRDGTSAGEKLVDADLIGLPWRAVVSEKTLVQNKVEVKRRNLKETKLLKINELKKW